MKTIAVQAWEEVPGQPSALPSQIERVLPGITQLPQSALAADVLLVPDQFPPVPTRRLIVLVPTGDIDEHALARRVWQVATCSGLGVLYLALSPYPDQVSYQRRRLASLAALTAYPNVHADTRVHSDTKWSQALRHSLKPGDLLICLAKDRTWGFFRRQALGEQLAADLGVHVYEFGDLQVKLSPPSQYWKKNVLAWIASITLMAAFFWLQVGIERASDSPRSTILLCLSVLVELYGLWKINEWIG